MKKLVFISLILILITGCGQANNSNIFKKVSNNINKANSYYLEGSMEIINNEDTYTYDVVVSYKKDNYYRVELTNTSNDHKQIILRNDDGVYVVTPNLNKSFKFQSDWPYNNSQVYLLDSIVSDISNDKEYTTEKVSDGYAITSKVNYPNNANLVKQVVYVDDKGNINRVEVLDTDDKPQIKITFDKIELNHKFEDNYFNLNQIININSNNDKDKDTDTELNNQDNASNKVDSENKKENTNSSDNNKQSNSSTKETATIDDIIYPMYLPTNTYLTDQETIDTEDGQRLILTFDGDSSFVLIEETSSYDDSNLILPVSGEIDFVADVLAVVGDNSVSWSSAGIDYYMASSTLEVSELLQIARSISALPVSK